MVEGSTTITTTRSLGNTTATMTNNITRAMESIMTVTTGIGIHTLAGATWATEAATRANRGTRVATIAPTMANRTSITMTITETNTKTNTVKAGNSNRTTNTRKNKAIEGSRTPADTPMTSKTIRKWICRTEKLRISLIQTFPPGCKIACIIAFSIHRASHSMPLTKTPSPLKATKAMSPANSNGLPTSKT